jgi:ornithine cyclodeaminase
MKLLLLSAADIEKALPMRRAVEVMKDAFRAFSAGEATIPQRTSMPFAEGAGTLLIKPGALAGRVLGAKLAAVVPRNAERGLPATSALMVCLSPETGEPEAILDGTGLTAWRTGAASGAATDLLADPAARVAAVFGAGGQARAQVLAIAAVREVEEVRICSPTRDRAEALLDRLRHEVGCTLRYTASPAEALAGARIVCTATTSSHPVFADADLAPGAHVNAIGSFRPDMREVPLETVARARIVVDSRTAAALEAGELVHAVGAGMTLAEAWAELGELVAGAAALSLPGSGVTLFKSVGLAVQDLAAAGAVLETARREGLGRTVEV